MFEYILTAAMMLTLTNPPPTQSWWACEAQYVEWVEQKLIAPRAPAECTEYVVGSDYRVRVQSVVVGPQ